MGAKGQPKTGGRKAGTPNRSTAALRELAQQYTDDAIKTLVQVMLHGESEAGRIAAAREMLDRGYGKPAQPVTGEDGGALQTHIAVSFVATKQLE